MLAEQLTDAVTVHGEGPVYSTRWRGVRWVDMLAGDILELDDAGGIERRHVGDVAAVLRPRTTSGWVVAVERGLALAQTDDLHSPLRHLDELWSDANERMNEGGCDPEGKFYVGSTTFDHVPGGARLVQFDEHLRGAPVLDDVTISNGLEWSPDGALAYYTDSKTQRIDVFSWDPRNGLHNRRPFVTIADGEPDGLTVDAEGGVWVAIWGGSAVHRYSQDGKLTAVVRLPVRQVSAVTFSGRGLDELIITTSRKGLGDRAEASAGALFVARPGVRGIPVREFAG